MYRTYDSIPPSGGSARGTSLAPLTLLLLSYGLMQLGPVLLERLKTVVPEQGEWTDAAWLSVAAAAVCALGVAAAFMMALRRALVDLQRQTSATLGPALGTLSGVALIALHPPLEFAGLQSDALAVLALSTSMIGGALVQRGSPFAALIGAPLAALPSALIARWLWSLREPGENLTQAFSRLEPTNRWFVLVLALVSVLITLLALLSRALREPDWVGTRSGLGESLRWPTGDAADSWQGAPAFRSAGRSRFERTRLSAARRLKTLWNTKAGEAPPYGFSVWRYHEQSNPRTEEVELMDSLRRSPLRGGPILIAIAVIVALAVVIGVWSSSN